MTDTEENVGLRITGGKKRKTFCYRYRDPATNKLKRHNIGHYPIISLAEARVELQQLKELIKMDKV